MTSLSAMRPYRGLYTLIFPELRENRQITQSLSSLFSENENTSQQYKKILHQASSKPENFCVGRIFVGTEGFDAVTMKIKYNDISV